MNYPEVPKKVVTRMAKICLKLPEAFQEPAWNGTRWKIRSGTFAHLFAIEHERATSPPVIVQFRCPSPEFDVLVAIGDPFFRAGWGSDILGMVLRDDTDWKEVAELMTESYCLMAPKKLVALVHPITD